MAVLLKTLPLLLVHLESYPDSPVSLLFTSCTLLTGPGEFPSWAASLPPCIFTHPWKRGDSGGRPPAGLSEWACLCSEGRGTERGAVETSASPHCQKERSESPRASTSVTADGWDEARQPSSGRGVFEGFAEPERRWDPPPPRRRLLNRKGQSLSRTFASQYCAQLSVDTPFQHSIPTRRALLW